MIKEWQPLLVIGVPRTTWCMYSSNVNYKDHPEFLEQIRNADRPLIDLLLWTTKAQSKGGRCFLLRTR